MHSLLINFSKCFLVKLYKILIQFSNLMRRDPTNSNRTIIKIVNLISINLFHSKANQTSSYNIKVGKSLLSYIQIYLVLHSYMTSS